MNSLSPDRIKELQVLAHRLGLEGISLQLFHEALCHSSHANEQEDCASYGNERLEFLGDAVIGLTVAEALFHRFPDEREGTLSKIKSVVVSKRILATRTVALDLGDHLLLGKGEEQTGGRTRHSILGNLFECIVGAIHISKGPDVSKRFILDQLDEELERAASGNSLIDYKSNLQERTQRDFGVLPIYRLLSAEGPDHDKVFAIEVFVNGRSVGKGVGKSKRQAEKDAAATALEALESYARLRGSEPDAEPPDSEGVGHAVPAASE